MPGIKEVYDNLVTKTGRQKGVSKNSFTQMLVSSYLDNYTIFSDCRIAQSSLHAPQLLFGSLSGHPRVEADVGKGESIWTKRPRLE